MVWAGIAMIITDLNKMPVKITKNPKYEQQEYFLV